MEGDLLPAKSASSPDSVNCRVAGFNPRQPRNHHRSISHVDARQAGSTAWRRYRFFKTVVQTQFCGLASQVNGRYGILNEVRKHLWPYVEAARVNEAADEPARDRKTGKGDATLDSTATPNLEKNHNGVYMLLFM